MSENTYDLTLERIALIRRMVVAWNAAGAGAPIIHPDAPYGSADRDGDIANVTGDDDGAEAEHRTLENGLAVFAQNARLKPGTYQYHNPLAKLDGEAAGDVFRDGATGETPEHITFAVTEAHLALIPHLNVTWNDALDVPMIDPEHPYRGTAPNPADDRTTRLHREMQPALQIFLRYADLGPGDFRRPTEVWVPA